MSIYEYLTTQVHFSWYLLPIIISLLFFIIQFGLVKYMRITVITLLVALIGGCSAVKYHKSLTNNQPIATAENE